MWRCLSLPSARNALVKRCMQRTGCLAALSIAFALAGNGVAYSDRLLEFAWQHVPVVRIWLAAAGIMRRTCLARVRTIVLTKWNEVRLPYAPNPVWLCAVLRPRRALRVGEMQLNPPMMMSPSEQIPPPQEQVMPEATRRPLIFQAPVQY